MKDKYLSGFRKKLFSDSDLGKKQIGELLDLCELVEAEKGKVLTKQYGQSGYFYFLLSGKVSFSIRIESEGSLYSVGESKEPYTPVGWSGFRYPGRYATTVICEKKSVLLRWKHRDLDKYFDKHPQAGCRFLEFVFGKSLVLLNQIREKIYSQNRGFTDFNSGREPGVKDTDSALTDVKPLHVLRQSPFFEIFPEYLLVKLAERVEILFFSNGDRVFTQGEITDGLSLLASGTVVRFFSPDKIGKPGKAGEWDSVALRAISYPGYIAGWTGIVEGLTSDTTVIATRDTVILHFKKTDIDRIFKKDPEYGLIFAKRLLWFVSNLLRNNRAKLISEQYELEIIAVESIIEQNSAILSVDSELHKVPHLLGSVLTLGDAFSLLSRIEKDGDSHEKALSRSCLDILGRVYREYEFYSGLHRTYSKVAYAPDSKTESELRIASANEFAKAFSVVHYVLEGWENLPDKSGNIIIFNHLLNHTYNTLPNSFQITLDSHFVSSLILHKKYGDPGIRIVRLPRAEEYGHQNYYGRLGHINVFTSESDFLEQTEESVKSAKRDFYLRAGKILKNGGNLVINPEGKSYETENSPGLFRGGAFLLAASIDPEPLIVPIALANFDKKVNRNVFSAIIKKPFRITEYVENPVENKAMLFEFLDDYRKEYRTYVEEAVRAADKASFSKNYQ